MISRLQALLAVLAMAVLNAPAMTVWADDPAPRPRPHMDAQIGLAGRFETIEGNQRRFEQYVTPPEGLYLSDLILRRLDPTGGASFEFLLHDFGEPGVNGSLWYYGTGLNLHGQYRRSRFFAEFDPFSGPSRRADWFIDLGPRARPGRDFIWSVGMSDVDMIGSPSTGMVDWRDTRMHAGVGARFGQYWADLNYEHEDFAFGVGSEYDGDTSSYSIAFTPASSSARTQISGGFSRQITTLEVPGKEVRSWNAFLNGWYRVSPDLDLTGELRHFTIDRTIIKNAYARRQTLGRLEAEYRVAPALTVTSFLQGGETDYLDGLQLFEVGVGTRSFGIGFRARPVPALKVRGQYNRSDNHNRPLSYNSDSTLATTLIYSTLERTSLSASWSPHGPWGLSADWQHRNWRNDAQPISNSMDSLGLTGWWSTLGGDLSLTASCLLQDFDLPIAGPIPAEGFTSKAAALVLAATYVATPRDTLSASYTGTRIRGATSNEYQLVTLGATHVVTPRDRVEVEVNFGDLWDNRDPMLDFSADLWRVAYRHDF
jgi:hypothetical protein